MRFFRRQPGTPALSHSRSPANPLAGTSATPPIRNSAEISQRKSAWLTSALPLDLIARNISRPFPYFVNPAYLVFDTRFSHKTKHRQTAHDYFLTPNADVTKVQSITTSTKRNTIVTTAKPNPPTTGRKTTRKPAAPQMGRPVGTYSDDSLPSRLAELDVGESESKVTRLPVTEATGDAIAETRRKMSNSVRPACARASDRTGNVYTTESGSTRSDTSDFVFVFVVVTRTE